MTTCLLLTSYILLCLQIALILAFFTKPWSETEDHLFGLKADSAFITILLHFLTRKIFKYKIFISNLAATLFFV